MPSAPRELLPVLWLTGPPGVGKTTAGWKIFCALTEGGVEAAYVDIDQLGICSPDPPDDPVRYRIEAHNLGAVLTNFQAAGARCAIVSGVIDADHGLYADACSHAAVTLCRLRVDPDELRRRFAERRGVRSSIDEALQCAGALDETDVAGLCVDTTGLSVDEVVRRVREVSNGWNRPSRPGPRPAAAEVAPPPPSSDTRVLLLFGATGVGKSTAGFQLFLRAAGAGRRTAYVDLGQVGMCRPAPPGDPRNHRLKARNAAALWRVYREVGVQDLVLVGAAESRRVVDGYTAGLEAASVTICRLRAGADALRRRIMLRGAGEGSWPEPGDPLKGRSTAWLARVAEEAAAESEALDRAGTGGLSIATDDLTAGETAAAVASAAGWP